MKELVDLLSTTSGLDTLFQFFIPGFIALLISGSIGPIPDADFGKRVVAAVGYSALNYAAMSLVISIMGAIGFGDLSAYIRGLFIFILPLIYPFIIFRLREKQFLGFSTPYPSAWDQFFARRSRRYYVRARLKNNQGDVLGYYGSASISSQSPAEQMVLLERAYDEDEAGNWTLRADTAALLLPMSECTLIEFIIPGEHET